MSYIVPLSEIQKTKAYKDSNNKAYYDSPLMVSSISKCVTLCAQNRMSEVLGSENYPKTTRDIVEEIYKKVFSGELKLNYKNG